MASSLSIYTTTFNCARTLPSTSLLSANLFAALTTNLPPDLIVLSLQEIAPLGYSFLGGSFLAPYFSRFDDIVQTAVDKKFDAEVKYETLAVRNVGLTGIMVFARQEVARKVRWMRTAGVGVGVMEMGNKGAVGVRVALGGEGEGDGGEDVVLTFVAAHLAPHEPAWEQRNADWRSICENLVFEKDEASNATPRNAERSKGQDGEESAPLLSSGDADTSNDDAERRQHTLFTPLTHLFFLGDLNYRTSDTAPSPENHKTYPKLNQTASDTNLFASDQLTRELQAGNTLHNLTEAPVTFLPTYKYSSAAQQHIAAQQSSTAEPSGNLKLWASHRWPSWCDRILYLSSASEEYRVHAYDALPIQPTSDHRPVALSVTIPFTPVKADAVKPPFTIREDWKERRAGARTAELVVGTAAYAGWTWEGEALTLGTVVGLLGGWALVRGLLAA